LSRKIYKSTIGYMDTRFPVSFRLPMSTIAEIDEAALRDKRKRANFCVAIFEWAWEQYREAGSLQALLARSSTTRSELVEKGLATDREVLDAQHGHARRKRKAG
jgi:hypothetical protein